MTSSFITYKSSRIHYRVSGQGKKLTVCLHGFGEYARSFDHLAVALPDQTLVAIDMPWHGETQWHEGLTLELEEWIGIIRMIPQIGSSNFGLLGYSMGGRICLSIYQAMPDRIPWLILIAPDGLKENRWYRMATRTKLGNALFRFSMFNADWLEQLIRIARKTKWVNERTMKFVHYYTSDAQIREKVYRAWTSFRHFRPNISRIRDQIRERETPVALIYGKYDRIILPSQGEVFSEGMGDCVQFVVLDVGHQILHPRNLEPISRAFDFCTAQTGIQA